MNTLSEKIAECKTLDDLRDLLNGLPDNEVPHDNTLTSLPTFGLPGHGVENTGEVFSWNDTHVLVFADPYWETQPRCKYCGEATFHCRCGCLPR
jgi:hypothetical protein